MLLHYLYLCFFRRESWKVLLTSTSASRCQYIIIIILFHHHHHRHHHHHHNSIVGGHWADLPVWQSVLPVHVWHQDPKASLLPCRWLWGRYDRMGWLGLSGNLGGPQKYKFLRVFGLWLMKDWRREVEIIIHMSCDYNFHVQGVWTSHFCYRRRCWSTRG